MQQSSFAWSPPRRQFTVSELTFRINEVFAADFSDLWIAGEISGAKTSPAGHWYFTLKDQDAQLQCACFKMNALRLRVKPQDGLSILARGRLEVYPPRGQYQLIVEAIELQGLGALQLAFEQLKKKLAAEGLFDTARKRPLPKLPRRLGLVTSASGAALQDVLNILRRRAPGIHVRLYPTLVQGDGAALGIARGIDYFSSSGWAEVVIAGRGGGSFEDLWAFNEEPVARAIYRSRIPVISAVGHETDFTIADFVADLRAPTPSAAAEIVSTGWMEFPAALNAETRHLERAMRVILSRAGDKLGRQGIDRARMMVRLQMNRYEQRVDECDFRLVGSVRERLGAWRRKLQLLDSSLRRHDPRVRLAAARSRHDRAAATLQAVMRRKLASVRPELESLSASLGQLSPLRVLDRGYALVQDANGAVVTSPPPPESPLRIRYADGEGGAIAK